VIDNRAAAPQVEVTNNFAQDVDTQSASERSEASVSNSLAVGFESFKISPLGEYKHGQRMAFTLKLEETSLDLSVPSYDKAKAFVTAARRLTNEHKADSLAQLIEAKGK
jgi:hypothetical protein